MPNEVITRTRCDRCPKVVERLGEVAGYPEGWATLTLRYAQNEQMIQILCPACTKLVEGLPRKPRKDRGSKHHRMIDPGSVEQAGHVADKPKTARRGPKKGQGTVSTAQQGEVISPGENAPKGEPQPCDGCKAQTCPHPNTPEKAAWRNDCW